MREPGRPYWPEISVVKDHQRCDVRSCTSSTEVEGMAPYRSGKKNRPQNLQVRCLLDNHNVAKVKHLITFVIYEVVLSQRLINYHVL